MSVRDSAANVFLGSILLLIFLLIVGVALLLANLAFIGLCSIAARYLPPTIPTQDFAFVIFILGCLSASSVHAFRHNLRRKGFLIIAAAFMFCILFAVNLQMGRPLSLFWIGLPIIGIVGSISRPAPTA